MKRLPHVFHSGELGRNEEKEINCFLLIKISKDKEKIDTLDYIKIKNIYSSKESKTVNNQATSWEKIFAIPISNQRCVEYKVISTNKSIRQSSQ